MLKFEDIILTSDVIEEESCVPDIKDPKGGAFFTCEDSVDKEEAERIGHGMVHTVIPYKMQNRYGKVTEKRVFKAAVLENERLKAVFLPELGGRLWSLYDKKYRKNLIYENDSVAIANLALCNAWFAGGVEWNVGMKGHSPFTCRPLFAKRRVSKSGNDILCMYEYEEIRGVIYSIQFMLEDERLLVRVKIKNTKNTPTYTYWWSNIAVEECGNRIYAPADKTYVTSYRDGGYRISKIDVTEEMSYPRHTQSAKDYFYDIPKDRKKWIACLDKDGIGLFHVSTDNLIGRKTFLWGTGRGGEHWNNRLAKRENYVEIQAGLAKTQFEHLPLGANEEISFDESYSLVDLGGGLDYKNSLLKLEELAEAKNFCSNSFDVQEDFEPEIMGSPRGFLTELLCGKRLAEDLAFPPQSLTPDFEYYHLLLTGKECGGNSKTAFVCDVKYKAEILKKPNLNEFDYYILSLIDYANGEFESSVKMIERSLKTAERDFSLCAAALFALNVEHDAEKAYRYAIKAVRLTKNDYSVVCLYAEVCAAAKKYEEFIDFYHKLTEALKKEGRLRMYVGKFLVDLNRIDEAEKYINKELSMPDIREGEYSTTNIWLQMYRKKIAFEKGKDPDEIPYDEVNEKYPIPYEIDFRMH